jgi:hypothetical protein
MTSRITLIAVLAASAATAQATEAIRPGYWATTNSVSSPIHESKTENRCITPKAISKFTSCYVNHHYTCICPEQSSADGRIAFHGDCVDAKGHHVQIEAEGSYTATTLQMSARGKFQFLGMYFPFEARTDAHRIGETCPVGSPGSDDR